MGLFPPLDPNQIPLANGPLRLKTPANSPLTLHGDGCLIEFLVPFPIVIDDQEAWNAISVNILGTDFVVQKPIATALDFKVQGAYSDETPDVFCSIIRVQAVIAEQAADNTLEPNAYAAVTKILDWLRVTGRQYWILQGSAGVSSDFRGSTFAGFGEVMSHTNFASYQKCVLVRPVNNAIWESTRANVAANRTPSVSESIFCDALMSCTTRDDVKALVELGVAAEIEVTDLLTLAANSRPADPTSIWFLEKREKRADKFRWKLETAARRLGLRDPATFAIDGGPPHWKDNLVTLYKFRGSVAHSGIATITEAAGSRAVTNGEIEEFIFAVESLFHWSSHERLRLGLAHQEEPWRRFTERPVFAVRDTARGQGFFGRSGPARWAR